ncbi:serine/threonine protein kinase [Marinicella meishanensis]|uniref:serine/threonine protein kinase n=1 Tax=Marinicella meishanensis TaxID=2873263 RepID=UPI001CBCD18C|nr:serine/threonine-protein kinase [Marinicella sp. NBU2979]
MGEALPKAISKYPIKGVLGQGAMGIVYLGYDPQIERQVAIKTIAANTDASHSEQDFIERFVQEARLLAKCNHPNIVTILEFGQQDQMAFMVMEYIQGPSLKQRLQRQQKLPLMTALAMFVQLLKALYVAHQNGIIHRDLKPENILLEQGKTLKLTDFGVAKSHDQHNLTQIGVAVGTPRYMAPEQMYGSDEVGPYTDVYSLFVILYELMQHVTDLDHFNAAPLPLLHQMARHNRFREDTAVPLVMHEFMNQGLAVAVNDRFESIPAVVKAFKPVYQQLKQAQDPQADDPEAAADETSGFFTTGTVITQSNHDWVVDDADFAAMRVHLADLIGPMADFILTHALKQSQTQDQFIMHIAEKLDNHKIRDAFIDRWRTP